MTAEPLVMLNSSRFLDSAFEAGFKERNFSIRRRLPIDSEQKRIGMTSSVGSEDMGFGVMHQELLPTNLSIRD